MKFVNSKKKMIVCAFHLDINTRLPTIWSLVLDAVSYTSERKSGLYLQRHIESHFGTVHQGPHKMSEKFSCC